VLRLRSVRERLGDDLPLELDPSAACLPEFLLDRVHFLGGSSRGPARRIEDRADGTRERGGAVGALRRHLAAAQFLEDGAGGQPERALTGWTGQARDDCVYSGAGNGVELVTPFAGVDVGNVLAP
jgi:hypothetical protein